jgi:hypothetical protein
MNKSSIAKLREKFIAENDGKSIITLKGKFGKQQGSLELSPVFDSVSEKFLGVEELTEEEKKKSIRAVDGSTVRKITVDMTLNLDRDFDVIDWSWIKECRQIAPNIKAAAQSNASLFYVYNEDTIIKEQVNKADQVFEAMSLVKNASATEKSQRLSLMMGSTSDFKELEIEHYLKDKAMNEPDKIIRLFSDKDMKVKIFLFDLIKKGVLRKDPKDKMIYFEDRVIGATDAAVVEFLKSADNQELVSHLKLELDNKK